MKKYKYKKKLTYKGKQYYIYGDTKEEIGRKTAEKLRALEEKQAKEDNLTVKEWAPRCIEAYKVGQAESTREDYKKMVDRSIVEYIGHYRLVDVTPLVCQEVLNKQRGKSKSQINQVYQALRFIFTQAHNNGYILENPTTMLQRPKGSYHPRRALPPLERDTLIKVASKERKYYCFLLMLFCGCRPEEACNCKGSDILIKDNIPVLHIRGTKTKSADRMVPIPHELYKLIKDTKRNAYISVYPSGLQIKRDNRRRLWLGLWYKMNLEAGTKTFRNALKEPYKIPKDLTPYCLRHEYCSELARQGVDIRIAQKLMGHANISMTANIYTHIEDEKAFSSIAKALNVKKVKSNTKTSQNKK